MSWKEVRNNIINNINDQINIFRKTSNCNDERVLRQNIIKIQYDVCRKIRKNFLNKMCDYSKRNILSYYSGFIKSPQAMSSIIPFDRDVILVLWIIWINERFGFNFAHSWWSYWYNWINRELY